MIGATDWFRPLAHCARLPGPTMQNTDLIYLDHAATTPLDPEVAAGLAQRHATLYGNPSSRHPLGKAARRSLDESRTVLAGCLGGRSDELIFTSGGTEALTLALLGSAGTVPGHIALSAVEHPAVRAAADALVEQRGWTRTVIPVDALGRVTPEATAAAITRDTKLVAVMLGQNEIGTINDVTAIARVVRAQSPRARIVVDAVQAFGKTPLDVGVADVDCVAVTAHKIHGPKGVGALWTRVALQPVQLGGGQEAGRRGGTESAPMAWALAEAARRMGGDEVSSSLAGQRDRLLEILLAAIPGFDLTGAPPGPERLPHILHFHVPDIPGEPLINALSAAGLCASTGSACGSHKRGRKVSHVLEAIGRKPDGAYLRLSVGRTTTDDEIEAAARIVVRAVAELGPFYT